MMRFDVEFGGGFIIGIVAGIIAALFAVHVARAQPTYPNTVRQPDHQSSHPPQDQELHEKFYQHWFRPVPRTVSCCSMQDCYPTEAKLVGGTWFALRREDRQWIPVPESVLEHNQADPEESPDGRSHVCMQPPGNSNMVFCFVLGTFT